MLDGNSVTHFQYENSLLAVNFWEISRRFPTLPMLTTLPMLPTPPTLSILPTLPTLPTLPMLPTYYVSIMSEPPGVSFRPSPRRRRRTHSSGPVIRPCFHLSSHSSYSSSSSSRLFLLLTPFPPTPPPPPPPKCSKLFLTNEIY